MPRITGTDTSRDSRFFIPKMPVKKTQAALLGGAFIGVLSALPIVSAANLCCCLWVIAGGVVAAYVLQQNHPEPITVGDGAVAGLLAGVVGAFVYVAVSIPFNLLLAPLQQRLLEGFIDRAPEVSGELRDALSQLGGAFGLLLGFVVMLLIGVVFATMGGLLGAVLFRRGTPPPPLPPAIETSEVLPPE